MGLASIRLKRGRALLPLGLKPEFAILVGMDEGQVNANLWDIPQGQQYMELSSNIKLLLNLVCVSVCLSLIWEHKPLKRVATPGLDLLKYSCSSVVGKSPLLTGTGSVEKPVVSQRQ